MQCRVLQHSMVVAGCCTHQQDSGTEVQVSNIGNSSSAPKVLKLAACVSLICTTSQDSVANMDVSCVAPLQTKTDKL